jgi:hypothetical protein
MYTAKCHAALIADGLRFPTTCLVRFKVRAVLDNPTIGVQDISTFMLRVDVRGQREPTAVLGSLPSVMPRP